jgi:hypothetical protein
VDHHNQHRHHQGLRVLFYRAAVDLSRSTLNYVAGIIRRHRQAIRSTWRRLTPTQQALLVLVYLRKGETFTELSAGFGVSVTTDWRYVEETVRLLRARAPKLGHALRKAHGTGCTTWYWTACSSPPTACGPTGRTTRPNTACTA